MAVVLDATVGGAGANVYCTLAEADAFQLANNYSSAWDAADPDQKNRALVTATRLLDEHVEWFGNVVTPTQALLWPQSGQVSRNRVSPILSTVIPQELKNAVAEFARQLLTANRTTDNDVETMGLTSLSVSGVALAFDQNRVKVKVIPDAVLNMIRHLGMVGAQHPTCVPLFRT